MHSENPFYIYEVDVPLDWSQPGGGSAQDIHRRTFAEWWKGGDQMDKLHSTTSAAVVYGMWTVLPHGDTSTGRGMEPGYDPHQPELRDSSWWNQTPDLSVLVCLCGLGEVREEGGVRWFLSGLLISATDLRSLYQTSLGGPTLRTSMTFSPRKLSPSLVSLLATIASGLSRSCLGGDGGGGGGGESQSWHWTNPMS